MKEYLFITFLLVSCGALGMEKQEVEGSIGGLIETLSNNKQYYERELQRNKRKRDELIECVTKLEDPTFKIESLDTWRREEFLITLNMLEESDYLKKYDDKLNLIEQEMGVLESCQNLIRNPSCSSQANKRKVTRLVREFKELKQEEDAIIL